MLSLLRLLQRTLMVKTSTDFKGLLEAGAVGFSDDGIPLTNAGIVKKAMELAKGE